MWQEDMNTGIDTIDKQHQQLFNMLKQLYILHKTNKHNLNEIKNILEALKHYTLTHFAFEEQIMLEAGYQQLSEHKEQHQLFIQKASKLHQDFLNGDDVLLELLQLVASWWRNHILHDDMAYARIIMGW